MPTQSRKSLAVIAKVTHDCNMGCLYCYTGPNAEKGTMDSNTLENMIRKIAAHNSSAGSTVFIWHGGEPLSPGVDFYRGVVAIQKTIDDHVFENDVQTSGTLLTPEFLDFFEEHHFHVGLSLDGPPTTHNVNRPYKDGSPSFDDVFAAVLEVRRRELGSGAICLLNRNTEPHLEEIYRFFKQNQLHLKVNVQFPAGRALEHPDLGLTPKEFGKAMVRLFDLWFYDTQEPLIEIEPFTDIMGNIGTYRNRRNKSEYPIGCNFRNDCANSFISVAPGGAVYPCGRFAGDLKFYMGNINRDSMETIMRSKPHMLFLQRHEQGVEDCVSCDYKPVCNSGCPDQAYLFTGNILNKDHYCPAYKMMFMHIERAMKQELGVK